MLSDEQIVQLAKRMGTPLEFCGFKDELPKKLKYNTGYIINLQDELDDDGKPNEGSHWTAFAVVKHDSHKPEPIHFDSFGQPPPRNVTNFIKSNTGIDYIPHTNIDIQSMLNSACGWYSLAFLYWIFASTYRTHNLYDDVNDFIGLFEDLDKSHNFKKNEFVLKTFFRSNSPELRKAIDIIGDGIGRIDGEDEIGARLPVGA